MPFYDEWDAEASAMYSKLETNSYSLRNLFDPHNGHRIAFTRITSIILYILNGSWDPELQLLVNAFLHALSAALLFYFLSAHQYRSERACSALVILVLFAIPYSWMSILVPFQTQFYYMILFSIVSMHGLCKENYYVGVGFAILSYFSMTPGAFVLPAYMMVVLTGCIRDQSIRKKELTILVLLGFLFLFFVVAQGSDTSTTTYSSRSIKDFVISLIAALWWPFNASNVIGAIIHLPVFFTFLKALRDSEVPKLYLTIAWFVWLQIFAMAFFRGAGGVPPANRYWEILLIGMVISFLSAFYFIYRSNKRLAANAFFLVWLSVASFGMYQLAMVSLTTGLKSRMAQNETALALVTEFIDTGNEGLFDGFESLEISYPDTGRLITMLRDPNIVSILPTSITQEGHNQLSRLKTMFFRLAWLTSVLGALVIGIGLFGNSDNHETKTRNSKNYSRTSV